jgi:hypothetical protein
MKRAHHPFLDPADPSWAERASDAEPARQGIVETGNGGLVHIPPAGSIPHQLSQGRSSGTEASGSASGP